MSDDWEDYRRRLRRAQVRRSLWSGGVLAVVVLVAAAAFAAASRRETVPRAGPAGVLRISQPVDFDSTDPALATGQLAWEMEYATCAKLVNYRASRLVPEAAARRPLVSRNGLTYTFQLRHDFRFNTGERVTAASFARAFERALAPELVSPAAAYLREVARYEAHGNLFRIRLRRPVPDLLDRLALPYFCAVPSHLPIDPSGVSEPPSAGPFTIAHRAPGQLVLERNPYYGGDRRRGPDRIVYSIGSLPLHVRLQVEKGDADYAALPPGAFAPLVTEFVASKQVRVIPQPVLAYLALNMGRPLFRGNPSLRRAVDFALDRRALVAVYGRNGGRPTDQYLPPQLPGFSDARIYPLDGPSLARARALARGHTRSGKAILVTCGAAECRDRAQIVQSDLAAIGIDVSVRTAGLSPVLSPGSLRQPYDIADVVWRADYADPYGLLEKLLDSRVIQNSESANPSYFDDPAVDRELDRIDALSGAARYRAFGRLDVEIASREAPVAAYATLNARVFLNRRVGCFSYSPAFGVDVAALCLR